MQKDARDNIALKNTIKSATFMGDRVKLGLQASVTAKAICDDAQLL
jgi:hypothetical protein